MRLVMIVSGVVLMISMSSWEAEDDDICSTTTDRVLARANGVEFP